jgi:hypothetical protein
MRRQYADYTDEEMGADIAAHLASGKTAMPDDMKANMQQFHREHRELYSECFTIALWAVSRLLGERTGQDAELALRHAVIALLRAATVAAIATNDALGKPVEPGRVALVAWTVAGAELDSVAELGAPAGTAERLLRAMADEQSEIFAADDDLATAIAKTPEG